MMKAKGLESQSCELVNWTREPLLFDVKLHSGLEIKQYICNVLDYLGIKYFGFQDLNCKKKLPNVVRKF